MKQRWVYYQRPILALRDSEGFTVTMKQRWVYYQRRRCTMDLKELKRLAESFRPIADNIPAVVRLTTQHRQMHPTDRECDAMCAQFRTARTPEEVREICDRIQAQTVLPGTKTEPETE